MARKKKRGIYAWFVSYLTYLWNFFTGPNGLLALAGLFFIGLIWGYKASFHKPELELSKSESSVQSSLSGELDLAESESEIYGEDILEETEGELLTDEEITILESEESSLTEKVKDRLNSFGQKIGRFFKFTLPSGLSVSIPRGGVEERFLKALENTEKIKHEGSEYFIFDRIYFDSGSSRINEDSFDQIHTMAEILKSYNVSFLLRGHTDSSGSLSLNQKLSLDRAHALKNIFIEREGISPSKVKVIGLGPSEPIANNDKVEGRVLNRRIDISVIVEK